jgi:phenylpropionate dioxygenase-like ring-hydroxylating dioxygenase large terminal subunit
MTTTLRSFWHPVARSEDIGAQPTGVRLLETDVVLFRDKGGEVHAWRDICIHRGTKLSLGRIEDGRLVCAYHGWEYDSGDGRCLHIPSLEDGATIPAKARCETFRAQDQDGLVWVALDEPAVDVPPLVPDAPGEWRLLAVNPGDHWAVSAGRASENSFDTAHTPFVHPGLLNDDKRTPPMAITENDWGFRADYPGVMNVEGRRVDVEKSMVIQLPFLNDIWGWDREHGFGYCSRVVASPVSPRESRLFVVNVRNYELDDDERFVAFSLEVMRQDKAVVESQRPEELPLSLREELHLKVPDALAMVYRRRMAALDPDDLARYALDA